MFVGRRVPVHFNFVKYIYLSNLKINTINDRIFLIIAFHCWFLITFYQRQPIQRSILAIEQKPKEISISYLILGLQVGHMAIHTFFLYTVLRRYQNYLFDIRLILRATQQNVITLIEILYISVLVTSTVTLASLSQYKQFDYFSIEQQRCL